MNTAVTQLSTLPDNATVAGECDTPPVDKDTPWDLLVREHSGRVYRLAWALTRSPHDAEDLTQDVFDRVFRNLASYTHENFDGWLYRITVNLFRDQVRKRHFRLEPLREDIVDRYCARQPHLDQQATEPVFDDDVRDALAALHPNFRAAVLLYDVDGLSYDEIAAATGVKRGTVGSRIHRGRAQLRAALAHRDRHTPPDRHRRLG